jgi:hypothetical protein
MALISCCVDVKFILRLKTKKLNKFKKLGYLKLLGCISSEVMYMRTNKPVNERHFTKIKNLKKETDEN